MASKVTNPLITVVTPTYNRAHLLLRLFDSLCMQTSKNFCWLIVDDGSTDNTEGTANQMITSACEKGIDVSYVKKENGGKHTALNLAFSLVNTELFFIVDSDDVLATDAVSTIEEDWNSVRFHHLCGISYLRGFSTIAPIGDMFPQDYLLDSFSNVRVRQNVQGDKAEVWATEYLKNMRFPVYEGERFLVESFIWLQVSKKAKMLFVNKIIYITEYLEGGLSQSGRKLRILCPRGGMAFNLMLMDSLYPLRIRIKAGLLYTAYSYFAHKSLREKYQIPYKGILTLCLVPGYILYCYWRYTCLR